MGPKDEDALAYLDKVKMEFNQQPHIYNQVRGHHTHVPRMFEASTSAVSAHASSATR